MKREIEERRVEAQSRRRRRGGVVCAASFQLQMDVRGSFEKASDVALVA